LRQRETVYVAKRRELQELEVAFRKRMDQRVAVESRYKEKTARNAQVIEDLRRQIGENQGILADSGAENERQEA
jgi:hypothetical protein